MNRTHSPDPRCRVQGAKCFWDHPLINIHIILCRAATFCMIAHVVDKMVSSGSTKPFSSKRNCWTAKQAWPYYIHPNDTTHRHEILQDNQMTGWKTLYGIYHVGPNWILSALLIANQLRTEHLDIFLFSAHHSMVFYFQVTGGREVSDFSVLKY